MPSFRDLYTTSFSNPNPLPTPPKRTGPPSPLPPHLCLIKQEEPAALKERYSHVPGTRIRTGSLLYSPAWWFSGFLIMYRFCEFKFLSFYIFRTNLIFNKV
ncbi:unnamed protein product [Eretmochelys imbricata]